MSTKVVLAARPIKTSETIDRGGNIIDARTKQIIQPKEADYIHPVAQPQEIEPQAPVQATLMPPQAPIMPQVDALSVQAQIDAVKDNLRKLEELKALKIQEMKETIKLLKKK
jgi:methyl coenzyme M reductase subunit C-like uncharacterized protein (methanogenesis marker protein 7)